ncbi:MAG: hypothetical protein ACLR6J_14405 [Parabacteroides merdae]
MERLPVRRATVACAVIRSLYPRGGRADLGGRAHLRLPVPLMAVWGLLPGRAVPGGRVDDRIDNAIRPYRSCREEEPAG